MTGTTERDAPAADSARALVELAHDLIRRADGEESVLKADLAALRELLDRAAARATPTEVAAVRQGLLGAGLGLIAPEGASLAAMQAGLRRLHALVTTLLTARVPRAARRGPA